MHLRRNVAAAILCAAALALSASARADAIIHWSFDDPAHPGADSSGRGNDATTVGAPTYTASGQAGGALAFDGADDGLYALFATAPSLAEMTVSWWVNVPAGAVGGNDWWELGGSGGRAYVGELTAYSVSKGTKYGTPALWNAGSFSIPGASNVKQDTPVLPGAGWHHLAATVSRSDNKVTLYYDGDEWNSSTWSASIVLSSFSVGYAMQRGDNYVKSTIDDVWVFDEALDASEVSYMFEHPGLVVPEPFSFAYLGLVGLGLLVRGVRRRSTLSSPRITAWR